MQFRRLGDSELEVSEICLGSWQTFGDKVGREQSEACTDAAFEAGINFFDTANAYGKGAAEELWGEVLNRRPRDSFVLATKLYFPVRWRHKPWTWRDYGLSAKQVRAPDRPLAEAPAHRLRRPLPVPSLRPRDAARGDDGGADRGREGRQGALHRLLGVADRGDRAGAGAARGHKVRLQPTAVLAASPRPEPELIPLCKRNGISQIVFSPLAQGVLSGKYRPGEEPPVGSRGAIEELGQLLDPEVLEAVQRLAPIAAESGLTMSQLALAWILREPNVAAAIIGATKPGHVIGGAAASGVKLSDDTLRAIDAALGDVASF